MRRLRLGAIKGTAPKHQLVHGRAACEARKSSMLSYTPYGLGLQGSVTDVCFPEIWEDRLQVHRLMVWS